MPAMHVESSSHDKAYELDNEPVSGSFSTTRDRETVVHNEDQGLPEINQPDIGQVASGERQVESLTDVEKLTQRCTISMFATYKVTKLVRKLHRLFRVCAWLEEYEWLTYSPSCGGRVL